MRRQRSGAGEFATSRFWSDAKVRLWRNDDNVTDTRRRLPRGLIVLHSQGMDQTMRPGDLLLGRDLLDADEVTREAARAQWKRLIRALLKVAARLAREEDVAVDSPNLDRRRTIRSLP
jgi:hypothetical protein